MKASIGRRSLRHSAQRRPVCRRHAGDDQRLEIGTMRIRSPKDGGSRSAKRARHPREHPNRPHVDETISSAGTAVMRSSRARPWPPHRRTPQLPSGPPSGEGQDSREILRSPRDRPAERRSSRDSRPRTRLSRRPPGSASRRLSAGSGEELVDPAFLNLLRHGDLPTCRRRLAEPSRLRSDRVLI